MGSMVASNESEELFIPCVRRWNPENPGMFVEGSGAVLKDSEGKEYIDLYSSHGCTALIGYNHPAVCNAIKKQAERLYSVSVEFPTAPPVNLAKRIVEITPELLNKVYFANAGTEAVEVALFLAKKYTKKFEFISLCGAFHGRTHGSRSIVGFGQYRRDVGPFLNGIVRMPSYYCYRCQLNLEYPKCELQCAKMLEDVLYYDSTGEPAAFIAEPIQGTAGNIPAPDGYFTAVKKILDKHGILLFIDEIYTAFGSTGKKFCHEHYGVEPDILTMSKTLAGGLPISAVVTKEEIAQTFAPPEPMQYFTTFGSNPLMAAAAIASLDTIIEGKLWEKAAEIGDYWMKNLKELQSRHEIIGDVRGKGIMLGVELVKDRETKEPAKEESIKLKEKAWEKGVIMPAGYGWHGNVIKLHPTLVMTREQIDKALAVLDESLKEIT